MTILSTLSRSSEFDKYEDILALIKQFAEEQHVYFRIHKPTIKVQCYNNQVKAEKKMDEKYIYKEVTYCCPHSVKKKARQHKGLRPEQNIMFCGCEALIQFRFNSFKLKFEIVKMQLDHKNHPVSEVHFQTYARKK